MATPKPLIKAKKSQNHYLTLKQMIAEAKKNPKTIQHQDSHHFLQLSQDEQIAWYTNAQGEDYCLLPTKHIKAIMKIAQCLEKEKFQLKLEQEIAKNMPIDFDDVWCIALNESQKQPNKKPKDIVQGIKKKYPYLFLEFNALLQSINLADE